MNKLTLSAIALASFVSLSNANGLGLGYDHDLAGNQGFSAKFDLNAVVLQGIVGFKYTQLADQADFANLSFRALFPLGARGPFTLYAGIGENVVIPDDTNAVTQWHTEIPVVAEYKITDHFAVSTQVGFLIGFSDYAGYSKNGDPTSSKAGFNIASVGSFVGSAGFHVYF